MTQHLSIAAVAVDASDGDHPAAELLDSALTRVARLETTLAASGGALHDVNNLLTVLAGQLYLLTEAVREQPALLARSRGARNSAERASALIRELLSAAREPDDSAPVVCPARHATAMEPLLRRLIDSRHRFTVSHSAEPWSVAASASQLESAIANLVINAHEALSTPGKIAVAVRNRRVDEAEAAALGLSRGRFVRLRVADTGRGIPKRMLARVMEPLVSGKPAGRGNGMGLAMVRRFAIRAGGAVRIDSAEGQGTTVDVWLPASELEPDVTANITLPLSTLPSGDETILLLSRDADVRAVIEQLLGALGYTILAAASRSDALRDVRRSSQIDVVICDRSARDRKAETAWAAALCRRLPGLKQLAVVETGGCGPDIAPDADAYVHRPVSVAELAASLRALLEDSRCR